MTLVRKEFYNFRMLNKDHHLGQVTQSLRTLVSSMVKQISINQCQSKQLLICQKVVVRTDTCLSGKNLENVYKSYSYHNESKQVQLKALSFLKVYIIKLMFILYIFQTISLNSVLFIHHKTYMEIVERSIITYTK